jgi:hypothetical protein
MWLDLFSLFASSLAGFALAFASLELTYLSSSQRLRLVAVTTFVTTTAVCAWGIS